MERRKFLKFFGLSAIFPFLAVKTGVGEAAKAPDINRPLAPAQPPALEKPRQILLAELFIAGFQYHEGMKPEIFRTLREGDELILRREPDNPYDPLAIAIFTKRGNKLGYVPRACNYIPAMIADQDIRLAAEIAEICPKAEPWERVLVRMWEEVVSGRSGKTPIHCDGHHEITLHRSLSI